MKYIGTRDKSYAVTASQAIIKGICPDGGLFIPAYPYVPDEDENSSDNSGGATGGW